MGGNAQDAQLMLLSGFCLEMLDAAGRAPLDSRTAIGRAITQVRVHPVAAFCSAALLHGCAAASAVAVLRGRAAAWLRCCGSDGVFCVGGCC